MRKIILLLTLFQATQAVSAQHIIYTDGNNSWNADSLGNHRAVVTFNGIGKFAKVIIEWRRRDDNPQDKRLIVQDAKTGQKILNVKTGIINNEKGEVYFEPVSGRGDYYIYYMPAKNEGRSNYPKGVYLKPENTASAEWLQSINEKTITNTVTKEIQSIDAFNSFYPMEVIATAKETSAIIAKSKRKDFIVFPENRLNPIKMTEHLPQRWIQKGLTSSFTASASKGEYYAFQLGLFALKQVDEVSVEFSDIKDGKGHTIAAKNISCINTSGIDYRGNAFSKTVNVEEDRVQALWCGIDVPQNAEAGVYKGNVIIKSKNAAPATIALILTVNNNVLADGGISEPEKQTRLKWLNSTLYQDNEVIEPYIPLHLDNNTISLLGRKIELNNDGFPKQVQTFFTKEMTDYKTEPNNILAAPIHFSFINATDEKEMGWKSMGLQFTKQTAGTVQWSATSSNDAARMEVNASMEFDGFIAYTVKITALQDAAFKNISLQIPFTKESSKYLMGLGQKGGYRPDNFEWKWDVAFKNQDGAWLGNVNAGLQYSLRDEKYVRPLNTNFYLQKPLLLPTSWGNDNKGGIKIAEKDNAVVADNYSGERSMKKGDVLYYNFTLLITPFHTINTDFQWQTRFYHKYDAIDSIKATGATIINIHHATPINPWINYPFIEYKKMKAYIDEAHSKGLKVKIYNTVREVSNRAYETFAMRSLGHEIYSPGKGGGFSWLQEHIGSDYIAAWFVPEIKDAAIVNSGMSRWHNYYVEGMNWLVQNIGIDGIYLDDVAFDRTTMKRIKRALTQDQHPGIIDLHSANQYNKNDGFNNSANLYMEHFPYLNRLWFGEYIDYNKNSADFFLTEVSGIPFGLMGEMLQDGGNAWRGMVYGMTNRMPWSDDADPRPIWKAWDDFGMQGTKMIGYWSDNCPVKTSNEKVLATVYKKDKAALVSIASWADDKAMIQLDIDWNKLGINPAKATITAPGIKNFQTAATYRASDIFPVEKGKGLLLVIKE
ncbi:MAG: glycoside hydrolase domain-containing protein [Bacteroidota bacterium]